MCEGRCSGLTSEPPRHCSAHRRFRFRFSPFPPPSLRGTVTLLMPQGALKVPMDAPLLMGNGGICCEGRSAYGIHGPPLPGTAMTDRSVGFPVTLVVPLLLGDGPPGWGRGCWGTSLPRCGRTGGQRGRIGPQLPNSVPMWVHRAPVCTLWGSLKRSARAVQLFGRLAVLETHTLRY